MKAARYDKVQFLEPAHNHDPSQISHLQLPVPMVNQLPEESKTSLLAVLESTSVAFASYKRLKDLVGERFHRLVPARNQNHADNEVKCSEPAFHNYISQIRSEKEYLFEEALPDWKHKAMRVDFAGQHNLTFHPLPHPPSSSPNTLTDKTNHLHAPPSSPTKILRQWLQDVRDSVDAWTEEAEEMEIPDFAETVAEYRLFQAKEIRRKERGEERNRRRRTIMDMERAEVVRGLRMEKGDSGVVIEDGDR